MGRGRGDVGVRICPRDSRATARGVLAVKSGDEVRPRAAGRERDKNAGDAVMRSIALVERSPSR
jgi:hypothetical protein